MPKISVIVPVYNAEKYISKCIQSILDQKFADFELILVDDGSPDQSGMICDEYAQKDSRIKVFHKRNGGVSSARNIGIREAKGEYITFIDADDYIDSNMLTVMVSAMRAGTDCVISGIRYVYEDSDKVDDINLECVHYNLNLDINELYDKFWDKSVFSTMCAKLYKAELIRDNNIFCDEKIKILEDGKFIADYLRVADTCTLVDNVYYNYIQYKDFSLMKAYNHNSFYALYSFYNSCEWMLSLFNQSNKNRFYNQIFNYYQNYIIQVFTRSTLTNQEKKILLYDIFSTPFSKFIIRNPGNTKKFLSRLLILLLKFRLYWLVYIILNKKYSKR